MEPLNAPKYYIVKRAIIEMIERDEFAVGTMIPSERDLMTLFDVSRITVRKAVEELGQEGYLYKVQGRGTFVKGDQNSQSLISITSCTEDVQKLGMTPSRKVLRSEIIPSDNKRSRKLNLGNGELVFRLSRVYYADDEPINYTTAFLPYKYLKGIEKHDFEQESLYDVLEKTYNIPIVRAKRNIEAIIAHDEISEYLDVPNGVAIILFECVTYGIIAGKECPIETFKCYYRSDKFKFHIDQVR